MIKKYPTIIIAIPAYNEEANISNILHVLLHQKVKKIRIKEIVVYSDASTDNMNKQVTEFGRKYPIVRLKKGKIRRGKYFRLNQIFKDCKADILVILDADVNLVGNNFLQTLCSILIKDSKAQMVAGRNTLLQPKNFVGKIIYAQQMIWEYVCSSIPNKDNAFNFYGTATAYKGSFVRKLRIPEVILDPHLYIYLSAKKLNGFRYCFEAEALQWCISTIEDLKKFMRRSIGKRDKKLEAMFGSEAVIVYSVNWKHKIVGFLKALATSPFYTMLALLLQVYVTRIYSPKRINKSAVWEIVKSSKKPIIAREI